MYEQAFGKYASVDESKFTIDGIDSEWEDVPDEVLGENGTAPADHLDLVQSSYWITSEQELLTILVSTGYPIKRKFAQNYSVIIYGRYSRDVGLHVIFSPGMFRPVCRLRRRDGEATDVEIPGIEFAVDHVAECRIPLQPVLRLLDLVDAEALYVQSSISRMGAEPCSDIGGMVRLHNPQRNHALKLLVYLLNEGCYIENDPVTLAFALANNDKLPNVWA